MNEKMLCDYLKEKGYKIYEGSDEITEIINAGDKVIFKEVSSCGYYKDSHTVDLVDLISWVYSKIVPCS